MTDSRPVIVIAGGHYQLPLIEAVQRRGLAAAVFDGSASAPGLAMADHPRVVDITDLEAVARVARAVNPQAVAGICSEVAVQTVAAVAEALRLPGLPRAVAEAATDKYVMRQRFAAAGLPVPAFHKADSVEEAEAAAGAIGYPVIVKPVDNSGSRGVRRVETAAELAEATALALSQSAKRRAIVEACLEGTECTVETFSVHGQTEVLGVSEKVRLPFPVCVSIDLTYPPSFAPTDTAAVVDAAKRAIAAIGLESGPAHVEVMLTADGPVVVELAARGGGYRIFSEILPGISGVDPVECVLDLALGRCPPYTPSRSRAAVLRFFNPPGRGVLRRVSGIEAARGIEGVHDVVIELPLGTVFDGITRDGERPGYVIAFGDTRDEAIARADQAEGLVSFTLDTQPVAADSRINPGLALGA